VHGLPLPDLITHEETAKEKLARVTEARELAFLTLPHNQDLRFNGTKWELWVEGHPESATYHPSLYAALCAAGREDLADFIEEDRRKEG
jgi:hypothetical protein